MSVLKNESRVACLEATKQRMMREDTHHGIFFLTASRVVVVVGCPDLLIYFISEASFSISEVFRRCLNRSAKEKAWQCPANSKLFGRCLDNVKIKLI